MKKVILALFVFPIVDVMFHTEKAKGLDAYTLCLAGLLFAFTFIRAATSDNISRRLKQKYANPT